MTAAISHGEQEISLEFGSSEIPTVGAAVRKRFGSLKIVDYGPSAVVTIDGEEFTHLNAWGDACLISGSDRGRAMLRAICRDLNEDAIRVLLQSFPPGQPMRRNDVSVRRKTGRLSLNYALVFPTKGVRWPRPAEAVRTDGLWRTTCFEAFIRRNDGPGYYEINLSPSGAWAVYAFDGYREEMREAPMQPPRISTHLDDGALILSADIGLLELPGLSDKPWTLGLSAVIEADDGAISYWALAHPSDKPDFHHPDSFVLSLPEPA